MKSLYLPLDRVARFQTPILLAALAAFFFLAPTGQAQITQTWNTNTPGNWSDTAKWDPTGDPAGNDIVFNDTFGKTANATTVGNTVNQNYTLNSLTYANSGTTSPAWQVTEISNGFTLTLNAAVAPTNIFTVAPPSGSQNVAIRGLGTFTINEAESNFRVSGGSTSNRITLDMQGLSAFNAAVNAMQIQASVTPVTMNLAATNVITATSITIGASSTSPTSGARTDVNLGQTNTLNSDTIKLGTGQASGQLRFLTGLTAPTVEIRGTAGGSTRANLTITESNATGNRDHIDFVDFRVTDSFGDVDALLDTLIIGKRSESGGSAGMTSTFSMDGGTVDANTVIMGQVTNNITATTTVNATLNIEGGTFKVNNSLTMSDNVSGAYRPTSTINLSGGDLDVTQDIIMGNKAGVATVVAANLNVSGGAAKVGGNLTESGDTAGVTSAVTISSGSLDMTHGNIAVDTFAFTGGTLKDVAAFAGALDIQNASTLAFSIDGSFSTLNLTGALTLGASSNLQLTLANGFTPGTSFTLVANDDVDLITGSFATVNGVAGNNFSLTNDMGTFNYTLSYVGNDILIIPEPATWALLAAGLTTVVIFRRRRRA